MTLHWQVDTFPTLPRVVVFMTVRFVPVPEVLPLVRSLSCCICHEAVLHTFEGCLKPYLTMSSATQPAWPGVQERYLVEQLGAPGFYHVIARYGYTQRVHQVRLRRRPPWGPMLKHRLMGERTSRDVFCYWTVAC